MGNKSCFRNETLQFQPVVISPETKLPLEGILEFDFIYLFQSYEKEPLSSAQFDVLYRKLSGSKLPPKSISEIFRIISEYIFLNSEQLKKIIELHEDSDYTAEVYLSGIGRLTDRENYDFIKTIIKPSIEGAMRNIFRQVGILNLFNPHHPDGNYEFNLIIYEERTMFNILVEMAKKEGIGCITSLSYNKKAVDKIEDFLKAIPKEGVIEMTYICPEESIKAEVRNKIGERYLGWNAHIDFSLLSGSLYASIKSQTLTNFFKIN